jgi:anti-anti-sigma factor
MSDGEILYAKLGTSYVLKFVGDIRYTICVPLSHFISRLRGLSGYNNILVDLSEAESIDSTNLGLLAQVANIMHERFRGRPILISKNENVLRTLDAVGFFEIFTVDAGDGYPVANMHLLSQEMTTEKEMATAILEAHRILSELNDANHEMFQQVVEGLEADAENAECRDYKPDFP